MRNFIFILIALLLWNCGGKDKPPKPDHLIPKDKMSDIIYDVFLVNAAKGINKKVLETNGIFPQEYVYTKYNIDSLQFAQSNDYYAYDIKTYEGIIDKVKQKIESEKKTYDALQSEEAKAKDSIKEAQKKEKLADTLLQKVRKLKVADTISPVKNSVRQK